MWEDRVNNIDEDEIAERLSKLGIPFADEYFPDSKAAPYAVYTTPEAEYDGADMINLYRKQTFRIELYTASKRDPLRRKLFELFEDVPFHVDEVSGGMKNFYVTAITFRQTLFDLDCGDEMEE
ncbi:MAG: hypothetical protein NC120_05110 [Ruminococcus sp.]|nr:hypothetical protein [Ruminococcus sp.]